MALSWEARNLQSKEMGMKYWKRKIPRSYRENLITSNWLDTCFRNEQDFLINEMYG